MPNPITIADFWARFTRQENGCLEWQKFRNAAGYGYLNWRGKKKGTHKVAWELTNGEVPEGLLVLHHCDNPPCGDPEHLFLGTDLDNNRDMLAKGRAVPPRGERNRHAKLTEAQVAEIRSAYAQGGVFQRTLGERFGVNQTTISRIVLSTTWRPIDAPTTAKMRSPQRDRIDAIRQLTPEIIRLHEQGMSNHAVGRTVGLHYSSVARVLHRVVAR